MAGYVRIQLPQRQIDMKDLYRATVFPSTRAVYVFSRLW